MCKLKGWSRLTEKEYIIKILETMHDNDKENIENINNLIKLSAINDDYSININDFKYDNKPDKE